MSTDERMARVVLSLVGEPGQARLTSLVARLGAARVLAELGADSATLGADLADRLSRADPVEHLERAAARGIRFVVPGDDEWPEGLDDLRHAPTLNERGGPPVGLWVRGPARLPDLVRRSVAVVGSRSSTTYGEAVAGELAAGLAGAGHCVVSGAAYGIDHAAHRGALAVDGPTLAVLPRGLDRAYPAEHAALVERIAHEGLVVSEIPLGGAPMRVRFLARNRLIAALAGGTVVVEAALRSGALNTANWAAGLGRPLMGVPGPVTSVASEGVHEMIRFRDAALVTRADEVLEVVSAAGQHALPFRRATADAREQLSIEARQVLDAVPVQHPAETSSVARTAGLRASRVKELLLELHGAGHVACRDGLWRLA